MVKLEVHCLIPASATTMSTKKAEPVCIELSSGDRHRLRRWNDLSSGINHDEELRFGSTVVMNCQIKTTAERLQGEASLLLPKVFKRSRLSSGTDYDKEPSDQDDCQ